MREWKPRSAGHLRHAGNPALIRELFDRVFREGVEYRATLVMLGNLEEDRAEQYELFEDRPRIEKWRRVSEAVDVVNEQYGKHTVRSASSLFLSRPEASERDDAPPRRSDAEGRDPSTAIEHSPNVRGRLRPVGAPPHPSDPSDFMLRAAINSG